MSLIQMRAVFGDQLGQLSAKALLVADSGQINQIGDLGLNLLNIERSRFRGEELGKFGRETFLGIGIELFVELFAGTGRRR